MKIVTKIGSLLALAIAVPVFAQGGASVGANMGGNERELGAQVQVDVQMSTRSQDKDRVQAYDQDCDGDSICDGDQEQVRDQDRDQEQIQPYTGDLVNVQIQTRDQDQDRVQDQDCDDDSLCDGDQEQDRDMVRAMVRIDGEAAAVDAEMRGSIMNANQVSNRAELGIFADSIARENARLRTVEASDDEVTLSFRDEGKLFGFINVGMNRTVRVSADADEEAVVRVSQPWWGVFVSGNTQARTKLEQNLLDREVALGFGANADAQVQARALDNLNQVIRAYVEADTEIEAGE